MCTMAILQEVAPRLAVSRKVLRITLLTSALLAALAICASLYIGYTTIGLGYIEGLQGRYFIPIIFALGAGLASLPRQPALSESSYFKIQVGYISLVIVVSAFALFNANFLRIGY
jgi:hypothetical protein